MARARPENNIAAVSARSGDGSLRLRMLSFDSIVMRARESTPHGSQRQAVQDSEPGALQHRISDRPVLARGRGQALSVRTRRFASSLVLADTYHSIAGREDRILGRGPAAVRGPASAPGSSSRERLAIYAARR